MSDGSVITAALLAACDRDSLVAWRVQVLDAGTGAVVAGHDADTVQRTASLGKLLLLVEVARRFADGSLDPEEPLRHGAQDWVEDSGLWWHLRTRSLLAADCAALVGAFSDNLATNVLLRRVGGVEAVRATAQSAGLGGIALHRPVGRGAAQGAPPSRHGLTSGSAAAYAAAMAGLHRGETVSPGVSRQVLDWLALGADLSMVGGAFGLDPLCHGEPDRGLQLWNKTGTIADVRGDVGVLVGPSGAVAYAVLTEWDDARHPRGRDAALSGMASIGSSLRHHVAGTDHG